MILHARFDGKPGAEKKRAEDQRSAGSGAASPAAKNLAMAHHIDRLIEKGLISDYTHAARMRVLADVPGRATDMVVTYPGDLTASVGGPRGGAEGRWCSHSFLAAMDCEDCSLSRHSTSDLAAVVATLNSRPRKTLNWRTPAEALSELLLSIQQGRVATTP